MLRVTVAEPVPTGKVGMAAGWDRSVRRVAVVSVHSSPLAPPGVGDSGGMNVAVLALADELA